MGTLQLWFAASRFSDQSKWTDLKIAFHGVCIFYFKVTPTKDGKRFCPNANVSIQNHRILFMDTKLDPEFVVLRLSVLCDSLTIVLRLTCHMPALQLSFGYLNCLPKYVYPCPEDVETAQFRDSFF